MKQNYYCRRCGKHLSHKRAQKQRRYYTPEGFKMIYCPSCNARMYETDTPPGVITK